MHRRLGLGLLSVLLLACGSSLDGAIAHLEAGRLPEAMREFRALEADCAGGRGEEALRYALYRGLGHFALGDVHAAERWLAPVKRAVDSDPRALSDAERGRLLAAWRSMGHLSGER